MSEAAIDVPAQAPANPPPAARLEPPQLPSPAPTARGDAWFYLLLFGGALAFLLAATWFYAGDVDEGFYAVAAELTAAGKMPYRDFFYPQAPLLPYLLAFFIKCFGPGFFAERSYCSLFAAGGAVLIAYAARREKASRLFTALLVALYCSHELVWQWIPSIRAYGPATFFLLLSLVLVTDPEKSPKLRTGIAAGAAAAIAVGCRLLFFPIVPVVIAAILLRSSSRPLRRCLLLLALIAAMVSVHAGWPRSSLILGVGSGLALLVLAIRNRSAIAALPAAGGVLIGALLICLPVLWIYSRAPDAFMFGNFGFHLLREPGGPFRSWTDFLQDGSALLGAGGMFGSPSAAGAELSLLVLLNVIAASRMDREVRIGPWLAAASLYLIALRPNPIYEHYFSCCAPLLVLGAIGISKPLRGAAHDPPGKSRADLSLLVAVLALFVGAGRSVMNSRLYLAQFGPWNLEAFRPKELDNARRLVAKQSALHPGPILALWPGSAVGSATSILPGFEDHFSRKVADQLKPEQRKKWHVTSLGDLEQALRLRMPALFVFDREADQNDVGNLEKIGKEAGYKEVATGAAHVRIWARGQK